jgi:hypothetical protein
MRKLNLQEDAGMVKVLWNIEIWNYVNEQSTSMDRRTVIPRLVHKFSQNIFGHNLSPSAHKSDRHHMNE